MDVQATQVTGELTQIDFVTSPLILVTLITQDGSALFETSINMTVNFTSVS